MRWRLRSWPFWAMRAASVLIALLGFSVYDSGRTAREAIANQRMEREALNRRIDSLEGQNARIEAAFLAVREQLLAAGITPAAELPRPAPAPAPRGRTTTTTRGERPPAPGPPTSTTTTTQRRPPTPPTTTCTTVLSVAVCR